MNDTEQMKVLADQLWDYFKPKLQDEMRRNVQFFRAQVVSNPGSNTLEVKRPFENSTLVLPCTKAMSYAAAGDEVIGLTFGSLSNAVIFSDGKMLHDRGYVTAGQRAGTTLGTKSTTEGKDTAASGTAAHAEGNSTTASANYSHAEGSNTTASGTNSHAEGYATTASGTRSHAEGNFSTASGYASHAEGESTTASGYGSHADGRGTNASGSYQHVFGLYNVADAVSVEIVGWGDGNNSRANIRTLDRNGNEWIAGTLTQGSDARLKNVEGEVPDVSGIRAVRFKWNDAKGTHDNMEHIGYLAQDVEKIAPYLVGEDGNGWKSLDYIALLCAKVDRLETELQRLKDDEKK